MRISTEIYRAADGNVWKIIREGEDVLIEQAIQPAELPTYEPYDDQRQDRPEAEEYSFYDRKGMLKEKPARSQHTISRKV